MGDNRQLLDAVQRSLTEKFRSFDYPKLREDCVWKYELDFCKGDEEEFSEIATLVTFCMKNNVLTDFAFTLTHVYLKLCKKDESIWNFRRKLIEEMPSLISIPAEVAFTSELLEKSAKCFQIYSHRKWLVNKLLKSHDWDVNEELNFLEYLSHDNEKNYMLWNFITWLCDQTSNYKWLKFFTHSTINEDYYNNSAYTARTNVWPYFDQNDIKLELEFIQEWLDKSQIENESLENYFDYFCEKFNSYFEKKEILDEIQYKLNELKGK